MEIFGTLDSIPAEIATCKKGDKIHLRWREEGKERLSEGEFTVDQRHENKPGWLLWGRMAMVQLGQHSATVSTTDNSGTVNVDVII